MAKKIYSLRFRTAFVEEWGDSNDSFGEHCARFGIPRQTGYEWLAKIRAGGLEALETRSCAPRTCPHATPDDIAEIVIAARKLHPTWGPRKLGPWLLDQYPTDGGLPAAVPPRRGSAVRPARDPSAIHQARAIVRR